MKLLDYHRAKLFTQSYDCSINETPHIIYKLHTIFRILEAFRDLINLNEDGCYLGSQLKARFFKS